MLPTTSAQRFPLVSSRPRGRRSRLTARGASPMVILALAVALISAGCSDSSPKSSTGTGASSNAFPKVAAAAGSSVPQVTVRFGMRPVANDVIYVIGMKQGWFKDVGINIAPAPYGNKSTFNNAVPLLINHQLDIEGLDPIPTISTLGNVKNIRFIGLSDIFLGYQILAAPKHACEDRSSVHGSGPLIQRGDG